MNDFAHLVPMRRDPEKSYHVRRCPTIHCDMDLPRVVLEMLLVSLTADLSARKLTDLQHLDNIFL